MERFPQPNPQPKVPYWDVKYVDNEGKFQIAQVKAFEHQEAVSEFRLFYQGQYKAISRVKQREDAHKSILE